MRLILIPPYQNPLIKVNSILSHLVAKLEKKGQLKGVEVDIDEGYFIESTTERRDDEIMAYASIGIIKKVREYSETGKYDAIVLTGGCEPGFGAARLVSKIPVASALHSAVHVASLIGDRFSIVAGPSAGTPMLRRMVENYGLGHKLASSRFHGHSSNEMQPIVTKSTKEERIKVPGARKIIDDFMAQCIAAIEKDRADTIIFPSEHTAALEDEMRQGLDDAGYDQIPIVCALPAGVAVAKAMVEMNLVKAPRAYPSIDLKAKPEYY